LARHPERSALPINQHMKRSLSLCSAFLFAGMLSSVLAAEETTAKTSIPARAGDGEQVGVGRVDGVTISGADAFITRNGVIEKLNKELTLSSGVKVRPDGTVMLVDGSETTLRATQILTFDGKVGNLPNATVTGVPAAAGTTQGGAATAGGGNSASSTQATSTINPETGRSARSMPSDRPAANGSVNSGTDGTTLTIPGTNGTTGQTLPAGTVTRPDGSQQFPDGSVRSATGQMMTPPSRQGGAAMQNQQTGSQANGPTGASGAPNGAQTGASQSRPVAVDGTGTTTMVSPTGVGSAAAGGNTGTNANSSQQNTGNASGGNTNSANNAGTVNPPTTTNNGNGNPGTTNSTGGSGGSRTNNGVSSGSSSGNSSGGNRGTNGAAGGSAVNGGGASGGSGGASGGSGGGASR